MNSIFSSSDPLALRLSSALDCVQSAELYTAPADGHKFAVGETRILTGLQDFPEFNGQPVEITAIRQDGPKGKAYYVKGEINKFVNWVYEYRLQ